MKLTIIAATGGVGRQLLAQALDEGHDVTAVARNPAKLLAGRAARIVTVDLAAPDAHLLESAVAGADTVLSALGPHNNSDAGIAAPGTPAIIAAMRAAGVRRIVAISAFRSAPWPLPAARTRPAMIPATGSLCAMPACGSSRPCSARSTRTWPGWKTCCASLGWTGPCCGPRSSPASRSPAATAPPWGATYAAAGPSPRRRRPLHAHRHRPARTPLGRSSVSPLRQDRHHQQGNNPGNRAARKCRS